MSLADFTNDELLIASLRIEVWVISGMFKGIDNERRIYYPLVIST